MNELTFSVTSEHRINFSENKATHGAKPNREDNAILSLQPAVYVTAHLTTSRSLTPESQHTVPLACTRQECTRLTVRGCLKYDASCQQRPQPPYRPWHFHLASPSCTSNQSYVPTAEPHYDERVHETGKGSLF